MSVPTSDKANRYYALVILIMLLIPVLNLTVMQFGFVSLFHNGADLTLFLFYAAPLWLGFTLFIGFELFRRTVIQTPPGHRLVLMMTTGGLVFSALSIVLCPAGPSLLSAAGAELILVHTVICATLGFSLRFLVNFQCTTQI